VESEKRLTPISFRPKERELEQIRLIQERKGCSQAGAIRFALDAACEALEPKEGPQPDTDWKALYFNEKELNESLSSRLMELSEKVADSLQAAQVLHGAAVAESKALESEEAKETRKSLWGRLKAAWRG
jgi:hypothetical protein